MLATAAELYGGADNSPAPPPVRGPGPLTHEPPPPGATPGPLRRLSRPARIAAHHTAAGGGTGTGRAGSDTAGPAGTAGNGMLIAELPVPDRPPRAGGRAPYTVNDQLLVATFLMVARWNREHGHAPGPERATDAPVLVTMPVDDRPRGAAMPIGNGTRLVSVGFGPEEHREAGLLTSDPPDPGAMDRLLRRTAARTRALKSASGAQLGLSGTVLTTPVLPVGIRGAVTRALRSAAAPWTSTTLLSNIGRIPYPLDFGDAGRPTAVWFSAPARMPRGLTVTTASAGGRIQLALRWSHALLDDAAGARLGDLFASSLAATAWTPPSARPAPPPRPLPRRPPRTKEVPDDPAHHRRHRPARGRAPPPAGLRDFYENPAVPVASGDARSRRQARMLARALGPPVPRPPPSWTSAAATAPPPPPPRASSPVTASSASTGRRTRCAALRAVSPAPYAAN